MENSIEEDVKNIEEIIELSKEEIDAKAEDITAILDIEDLISLEHILSSYKKALKENEEVHKENEHLHREINRRIKLKIENEKIVDTQFISIQKIKDKIEELKAQYKTALEENSTEAFILKCQITILQELIEEREEKE